MENIRETWEVLKTILIESRDVDDTILEEYKRMRTVLLTLKIEGAHLSERGHPNGISPIADQLAVIMNGLFDLAMDLKKDEVANTHKVQVLDEYFKNMKEGVK